jgi:hypothetical protein
VVQEFDLPNKVFFVTLDNASVMVILKLKFNGNIDVLPQDDNDDDNFLHQSNCKV